MKLYRTDWNMFPKTVIDRGLGDAPLITCMKLLKQGMLKVRIF